LIHLRKVIDRLMIAGNLSDDFTLGLNIDDDHCAARDSAVHPAVRLTALSSGGAGGFG
jgi:hypothetical protein